MKYILIVLSAFIFMSCDVMYMNDIKPYTISQENKSLLNEMFDNKVNLDNIFVGDIKTEWLGFHNPTTDSICIDKSILYQENKIKYVLMHELIHRYEWHKEMKQSEVNSYKFMYIILDWNKEGGNIRNGVKCLELRQEWISFLGG